MKRIIILLLPLLLLSCTKESRSRVQGEWHVDSIQEQIITSTTESGWQAMVAALSLFYNNETLTIGKSGITPCPTMDAELKKYDNYPGYVNYSFSGTKLNLPQKTYTKTQLSGNEASVVQTSIPAITLDASLSDDGMTLTGTQTYTDNLGNVSSRTNYRISLTRN